MSKTSQKRTTRPPDIERLIWRLRAEVYDKEAFADVITLSVCHNEIKKYFNGDTAKVNLWFSTENPGLGNVEPLFMFASGRVSFLLKWIRENLHC